MSNNQDKEQVTLKNQEIAEQDELILKKLGFKSELFRGFGAIMSFLFCFTTVNVLSSISMMFKYGMTTGGPAVMIWAWIVGATLNVIAGFSMAEICSSYPTAGSVYHWTALLAPKKSAAITAYMCGQFNFLANVAADAGFAYAFAQCLAAFLWQASDGSITWDTKDQVICAVIIIFVWGMKNLLRIDYQGIMCNIGGVWQICSTFIIIIALLVAAPSRSTGKFVFTEYYSEVGTNNVTYVVIIGLLVSVYSFAGYESAGHMTEETRNASISAPKGIIFCCLTSALLGLIYILGLLFACNNQTSAIISANEDLSFAVANVYEFAFTSANGVKNKAGYSALTFIELMNLFFGGFSSITVTVRVAFALARDKGIPFSKQFYQVSKNTKVPIRCLFLIMVLDWALLMLPLGSDVAFTAIIGIATIAFSISYVIPIFLRITSARKTFQISNFHLGRFSIIFGIISTLWLSFTIVVFNFPYAFDENGYQTLEIFNWTPVVLGSFTILIIIYWFFPKYGCRYYYKLPKRPDDEQVDDNFSDPKDNKEVNQIELN